MRKIFLTLSFFFLGYLCYGIYLSTFDIQVCRSVQNMDHHPLFYDYKGITHVVSSYSRGSSLPQKILLQAKDAQIDFIFFTDLNVLDQPYNINGYHGSVFVFSNQKVSYLDSHILIYTDNPNFHFNNLADAYTKLSLLLSENPDLEKPYLAVLAHPFKEGRSWTGPSPMGFDGVEIINLRHIWQQSWLKERGVFLWSVLIYPFNPHMALSRIIKEPKKELKLWDFLNRNKQKTLGQRTLGFLGNETTAKIFHIFNFNFVFPSYSKSFKFASNHILLDSELTGFEEVDRKKIFQAVKKGHFYMAYDGLGQTKGFAAYVSDSKSHYLMGSEVKIQKKLDLVVDLPSQLIAPSEIRVYKDGRIWRKSKDLKAQFKIQESGIFRVTVQVQLQFPFLENKKWVTWIYTNPFFITK